MGLPRALIALAAVLTAMLLLPFGGGDAVFPFQGDLIVFVYFFGVARLATVLAALDAGSSFEGMGASREVWVASLAEPALMLALAAVAREVSLQHPLEASLSFLHDELTLAVWARAGLVLALVAVSLGVVLLAETSRIPIDDPTTHLELTMIHEVMILDHGGPDLAFILYTAALKFWMLATLLAGVVLPARTGLALVDDLIALLGVFGVAVGVGVIESIIARLRLVRIPQLLIGASSLAALACVLVRQKEGGSP